MKKHHYLILGGAAIVGYLVWKKMQAKKAAAVSAPVKLVVQQ
jgi:hypothetical protein